MTNMLARYAFAPLAAAFAACDALPVSAHTATAAVFPPK
jgi:hypothetical protein